MDNQLLNVSSAPHVRSKDTTQSIMRDVLLALLPTTLVGIWNFGWEALLLIVVSMTSAVALEALYQHLMKKPIRVMDGSAAVTGLLLALNVTSTLPVGMIILGNFIAIIVIKQLFGGIGQNIMNPALGARCFLVISFAAQMTSFTYDGITGPTPLQTLKFQGQASLWQMFLGNHGGTIGETSALALLLGAGYLFYRRIIRPTIPFYYIGTLVVFMALFGGHGLDPIFLAKHVCGGGLFIGAFFMATDYTTSPTTHMGRVIFGILCGLLTGIFRVYGASVEGVSFSIIFANLLVPLIERYTMPYAYGSSPWNRKKNMALFQRMSKEE